MVRTNQPPRRPQTAALLPCGCYYCPPPAGFSPSRLYLPMTELKTHVKILGFASTTRLTQVFQNPGPDVLRGVYYTFPLYDGVSIGEFTCKVGQDVIRGIVKQKDDAKAAFDAAVQKGETAGLLTQSPSASDVFTTSIGNLPGGQSVTVDIVYVGELKHDAQIDGVRYTIPTAIAPRYSPGQLIGLPAYSSLTSAPNPMSIKVDIALPASGKIERVLSPSHAIDVSIGRLSSERSADMTLNKASATLALQETALGEDFVLQFAAQGLDAPCAMLESHTSLPHQRCLMVTAVPKFEVKETRPEIIFVVDRSGSMNPKMETLKTAMRLFLKSLPLGVHFNLCSFGSSYQMLWSKSQEYSEDSLLDAERHVETFQADFGGTEILNAVRGAVGSRSTHKPLEIVLLTDGEVWNQQELFDFINRSHKDWPIRFFSLGVGSAVSTSLVSGIARAGGGFAEFAANGESMDIKLMRLLKGTLSPQLQNASFKIKWDDEEYEMVENVSADLENAMKTKKSSEVVSGRYGHLPPIRPPGAMQTPSLLPPLLPFSRFTAYLMLGPDAVRKEPASVTLVAESGEGPIEIDINVESVGQGQMIHQLAARKAMLELEEGRGWVQEWAEKNKAAAKNDAQIAQTAEREAVRLGVKFQILGKHCSFVAVKGSEESLERMVDELRNSVETLAVDPTSDKAEKFDGMQTLQTSDTDKLPDSFASQSSFGPGSGFSGLAAAPSLFQSFQQSQPRLQRAATPGGLFGPPQISQAMARERRVSTSPAPNSGYPTQLFGQAVGGAGGSSLFSQSSAVPHSGHPAQLFGQPAGGVSGSSLFGQSPAAPNFGNPSQLFGKPAGASGGSGPAPNSGYASRSAGSFSTVKSVASSPYASRRKSTRISGQPVGGAGGSSLFSQKPAAPAQNDDIDSDISDDVGAFCETDFTWTDLEGLDMLDVLVRLQAFRGSWRAERLPTWRMDMSATAFKEAKERVSKVAATTGTEASMADGLATACVLAFLETKMADRKQAWELLADKARRWLATAVKDAQMMEKLMAEAKALVGDDD